MPALTAGCRASVQEELLPRQRYFQADAQNCCLESLGAGRNAVAPRQSASL